MRTIIRHTDNKKLADVTCSQCNETRVMDYASAKRSDKRTPNGFCNSCTVINRNKSKAMRDSKSQSVDLDMLEKNKETNGLYILKFTDRRQKCIVRCNHCKDEYERLYRPNIYEQYGCSSCSLKKVHKESHKHPVVGHKHRLYRIFNEMMARTGEYNSGDKYYLSKDIKICDEWLEDRTKFFDWALANGYEDHLTIDRENNDLGYSPNNCRWVTKFIQQRNTRLIQSNNTSGYRGVSLTQDKTSYRARLTAFNKEVHIISNKSPKVCAYHYDKYVIDNSLEHTRNFTDEEFNELTKSLELLQLI